MKLFVANLPFKMSEDEFAQQFRTFGEIHSVKIITDRETGRSRGFGFIELDDVAGRKAIANMDGQEIQGRQIKVSEAKPREQHRPGFRN